MLAGRQDVQLLPGMREHAVELLFHSALRGRERLRLALQSGVVMNQPGLVQAVDGRDALDSPLLLFLRQHDSCCHAHRFSSLTPTPGSVIPLNVIGSLLFETQRWLFGSILHECT